MTDSKIASPEALSTCEIIVEDTPKRLILKIDVGKLRSKVECVAGVASVGVRIVEENGIC